MRNETANTKFLHNKWQRSLLIANAPKYDPRTDRRIPVSDEHTQTHTQLYAQMHTQMFLHRCVKFDMAYFAESA